MEERTQKLKSQMKELLEWKVKNSIQQIPFNPPVNTTRIMNDSLLVATGNPTPQVGITFDVLLELNVDNRFVYIPAKLRQ